MAAAQAAVEEALRLTPAQPPTAARTRILAQAAGLRLLSGDPSGAATMARDAIQIAEAIGGAVRGGPGPRRPRLGRGPDRRRGRRDRHVPPWAVDRGATRRCRRDRARARQPRRPARSGRAHRGVAGSCARGVRDRATSWRAPDVRRRPPGSRGQGLVRSRPLGRGCGGRRPGARARSGRSFRDLAPSQPSPRRHEPGPVRRSRGTPPTGARDRRRGRPRHDLPACRAGGGHRTGGMAGQTARRAGRRRRGAGEPRGGCTAPPGAGLARVARAPCRGRCGRRGEGARGRGRPARNRATGPADRRDAPARGSGRALRRSPGGRRRAVSRRAGPHRRPPGPRRAPTNRGRVGRARAARTSGVREVPSR